MTRAPTAARLPAEPDTPALLSIVDLRPAEFSTDGIADAFRRLVATRAENEAEITRLDTGRAASLMVLTTDQVERNDTTLRRRRVLAEQLGLLEGELRRAFDEAKTREENEAYAARATEVRKEVAAFVTDFEEYAGHARAIAALLQRDADVWGLIEALGRMPRSDAAPGASLPDMPTPSGRSAGARFHQSVALPGTGSLPIWSLPPPPPPTAQSVYAQHHHVVRS